MTTTTETIFVTNAIGTGSTFAVTAGDQPSQVYIPASIAIACELKIGGSYTATLVPNAHENSNKTPWLCVRIDDTQEAPDPTQRRAQSVSEVVDRLAEYEWPIDGYSAGLSKDDLNAAWEAGEIVKVEARQGPDGVLQVLWTDDMEKV